jgi:dolichyl-phosphate-mannose--protein O-mannosyl transferase
MRWYRAAIAAAYLLAVAVNFAYLYPVLTGSPISHSAGSPGCG